MKKRKIEIPLSRDQLADLGEIVAIHGAIAFLLETTTTTFLPAAVLAAGPPFKRPVRHDELAKDARRWLDVLRPHLTDAELECGERFTAALDANVSARSDLVHSAFVIGMVQEGRSVGYRTGLAGPAIAKRLGRAAPPPNARQRPRRRQFSRQVSGP
jgi:hypothetical protein